MKTWKKVLIGVGGLLLALIVVGIIVHQSNKGIVTVQTGISKECAGIFALKRRSSWFFISTASQLIAKVSTIVECSGQLSEENCTPISIGSNN